jgi:hypothetical protein
MVCAIERELDRVITPLVSPNILGVYHQIVDLPIVFTVVVVGADGVKSLFTVSKNICEKSSRSSHAITVVERYSCYRCILETELRGSVDSIPCCNQSLRT